MSEEEREEKMKKFVQENQKDLKAFGWLNKMDDSKGAKCTFLFNRLCTIAMSKIYIISNSNIIILSAFMLEKPHLACDETANYLVIQCLNLEMEEKHGAMEQVAHQCICTQYLLELAKQLDVDPRSCISSFFTK